MDDGVDARRRRHSTRQPDVSCGSSTAQSAVSGRAFTASFTPPSQVITEIGVASEPVPAVVGTRTSGSRCALGDIDAPDGVEIVARAEQIGGELGDIHRASAAEADDRRRAGRASGLDGRFQGLARRIGLDRVEDYDARGRHLRALFAQASVRPRPTNCSSVTNRHGPSGSSSAIVSDFACAGDQSRSGMEGEAPHERGD